MLITTLTATAQSKGEYEEHPMVNMFIGPGLGLEYGGIGGKFEYLPIKYLGIFGAGGYNLAGFGWNAGLSFKVLPGKKVTPIIDAMYGYNAIVANGFFADFKTYYGPTFGGGVDIRMGRRDNKLTTTILFPVHSSEYKALVGEDGGYSTTPVTISVGFNYSLN